MTRPSPGFQLLFLSLLLALVSAPLFPAQAVVLSAQEQVIADKLVNASGQHRSSMKLDPILTQVARARAADMADRGYFGHVNPDGEGPNYLIEKAGYKLPDAWGNDKDANFVESIAAGRPAASDTWGDWMNSAPHKTHLLAEDSFYVNQTNYGVGFVADSSSPYNYYWVVITAPPQPTPNLTISSPAEGLQTSSPLVSMAGKAGDTLKPASVVFRVENSVATGTFLPLSGVANWSGTATGLLPGSNTIRFRSLSATGATLAEATRTVVYTVFKPLTVSVSGGGSVTAGFLGTTDRQLAKRYTMTAQPAAASLFVGWSGTVSSSSPTLTFQMVEGMNLQANFVANPFLASGGSFTGLVSGDASGLAKVKVGKTGAFTGTLRYLGKSYPLHGRLLADGTAALTLPRHGLAPLALTLSLDLANGNGLTIAIADGELHSAISAEANYQASTGAFAAAGRYTISLPAAEASSALPQGSGWATLVVDSKGGVKLSGALASGTSISAGGSFSQAGTLALYLPLYRGKGELSGLLSTQATASSALPGTLHWEKPATPGTRLFPDSLEADLTVVASLYVPPAKGSPVLSLVSGQNNSALVLEGGELESVVQPMTIDPATNQVAAAALPVAKTKVSINTKTGLFSGSFLHPVTQQRSVLHGVILQSKNAGYGFFQAAEASGSVTLAAMQ